MRTSLLTLPFMALFLAALGAAAFSSLKDMPWISYGLIALAVACLAGWVSSDLEGFKRIFTRKGAKYGASSGVAILLAVLVIVALGFVSNRTRFNKSIDITRDHLNTLSDQSQKIVDKLKADKKEVEVEAFFSNDAQKDKFQDLMRMYEAAGLPAKVSYINPKTDPSKAMAASVNNEATVVVKLGEQQVRVTTFSEEKMTNALVNATKGKGKKIYFIKGHGEGDITSAEPLGLTSLVETLKDNRFAVDALSLSEVVEVPGDADLLVVNGPKYDFREPEIALLQKYTDSGRPLFVMVDALVKAPLLTAYLQDYGIKYETDILTLRPDDQLAGLLGQFTAIVTEYDKFSPMTRDFANKAAINLILPNARSVTEIAENKHQMKVSLVGKTAQPILAISQVETQKDLEALAGQNVAGDRVKAGPFGVFAVATGRVGGADLASADPSSHQKADAKDSKEPAKELRIVAVGSSQFANNAAAQRAENADMFLNITNYLLQDEDFISIRPRDATKSTISLATPASQFSLLLISYLYPFMFLGSGIVFWLKRRRA